ncbi:MAG: hypothetical protein IPG45_05980 [Deltaproteobacteria bacterium]|nr:hypothetical protein [Deltaproteobacteria bacterium]
MALQVSLRDPGAGAGLRVRLQSGGAASAEVLPVFATLDVRSAAGFELVASTRVATPLGACGVVELRLSERSRR